MAMTLPTRVILAAALLAAAWFTGIGQRDLFQTDEGRYAEIPREMVVSGDWVTPRLDGLKYFEKPPLQYWATAVVYEAFGASNATSRLWTALTGFLCLLMTGYAGTRLFGGRSAWFGVLTLVGSVYFTIMGHFNTLDMGVTFFMCGSLFGFLLAMEAASLRARRAWMYAAWVMAALATLSKGLEAVVLPGAVFLLYVGIKRDWVRFRQLHFVGGLLIYLVIAAPWFLLVSLRNPEFVQFFFIHEHFQRFLTKIAHRYEPWWFFIPILLFGLWCFLPQFLRALVRFVNHELVLRYLRRNAAAIVDGDAETVPVEGRFDHGLFLWLWCGFIFLFFSLSDSKLGSYILPIFPALALLVGRELARLKRGDAMLSALCCIVLAIAALWQAPELQRHGGRVPVELYQAFLPWLMAGCGALLLLGIAGFLLAYFDKVATSLVVLGAGMFLATQTVSAGAQVLSPIYSQHSLALAIAPYDKPGQPFYSLNDYPQSLPFYLGRTMTIVAYQGELEFGIGREPRKWIPELDTFAAQWRSDPAAIAVMPPETYDKLAAEGLPMIVIGREPDHVAVRKP
ncbi:MAG TPA: glycosyltransferase family 39 protein [Gammaproteobacteria bacterium]|nr:glycosyltransferase family 39 protein [Gammaproteobacteria bacterium]